MAPFLVYKCRGANAENGAWVPREVVLTGAGTKGCRPHVRCGGIWRRCLSVERDGLL